MVAMGDMSRRHSGGESTRVGLTFRRNKRPTYSRASRAISHDKATHHVSRRRRIQFPHTWQPLYGFRLSPTANDPIQRPISWTRSCTVEQSVTQNFPSPTANASRNTQTSCLRLHPLFPPQTTMDIIVGWSESGVGGPVDDRTHAERWVEIAEKLLAARDLIGCKGGVRAACSLARAPRLW